MNDPIEESKERGQAPSSHPLEELRWNLIGLAARGVVIHKPKLRHDINEIIDSFAKDNVVILRKDWDELQQSLKGSMEKYKDHFVIIPRKELEDEEVKKLIDECLIGCKHDGSYVPVSEVKRLMREVLNRLLSKTDGCNPSDCRRTTKKELKG